MENILVSTEARSRVSIAKDLGLLKRMLDTLTECKRQNAVGTSSVDSQVTELGRDGQSIAEVELRNIPTELLCMDDELYSPEIDASTISLPNMLLASFWLQSCMQKHKVCADFQQKGHLPSRIINISNPQKPILHEGLHRDEPYITLSYKWGEARRYITTTKNLMRHTKQGIPPRTSSRASWLDI